LCVCATILILKLIFRPDALDGHHAFLFILSFIAGHALVSARSHDADYTAENPFKPSAIALTIVRLAHGAYYEVNISDLVIQQRLDCPHAPSFSCAQYEML
jgi:hypothetical protein